MKDIDQIILTPIVTEKSNGQREKNKYTFKVHKHANKIEIMRAIKAMFNVTPVKCNIINIKPKPKRQRYVLGYTVSWKKAIVTLNKADKITVFEGV